MKREKRIFCPLFFFLVLLFDSIISSVGTLKEISFFERVTIDHLKLLILAKIIIHHQKYSTTSICNYYNKSK